MALLDTNLDMDGDVFRNIVSLRTTVTPFDDISDNLEEQALADDVEMRVRFVVNRGVVQRGFAWSAAIAYPFAGDHLVESRYSNGSYPVWYGALEESTATHETAWHALQQVRDTPTITSVIERERAVWRVHADGIFVDLRGKVAEQPALVTSANYVVTQAIGKRVASHHPGLLAPSARRRDGARLAAFTPNVLAAPSLMYDLTYRIDPVRGQVCVERPAGTPLVTLDENDLCPW
jgi:hypothetical protein